MMLLIKIILIFLFISYAYVLLADYFFKPSVKSYNKLTVKESAFISIIIIARNEEHNLPKLFQSFNQLKYQKDKLEIILIDDDSTDNTFLLMNEFKSHSELTVKVLRLNHAEKINHPKKYAIKKGVEIAKGNIIALSDADCLIPPDWLLDINQAFIDEQVMFAAGPVRIDASRKNNILYVFESIEWSVLQALTFLTFNTNKQIMCNGANMAFRKNAFNEVGAYDGDKSSSGDDVFLMLKIKKKFGVNAIKWIQQIMPVTTFSTDDFSSFISQRIRWASKSKYIQDKDVIGIGIIIFAVNFCILLLPVISAFYSTLVNIYFLLFLFKLIVDSIILKFGISILKTSIKWQFIPFFALVYPFYLVFISLLTFYINPVWKARKINE